MPINKIATVEGARTFARWLVYAGDPTTAGGMVPVGVTEGDLDWEEMERVHDLTIEELTGEAPIQRKIIQEGVRATVPIVLGPRPAVGALAANSGVALYDVISSVGAGAGGGYSEPKDAATTCLLLIPANEVGDGLSYGGVPPKVWAGGLGASGPVHARWIWKATAEAKSMTLLQTPNSKVVVEVPFRSMLDLSKPEGQMFWSLGVPHADILTTLEI